MHKKKMAFPVKVLFLPVIQTYKKSKMQQPIEAK